MRFQVPQFIEIEDKIVGPLTLKQFVYLAGGAGMCVVAWTFLPFIFAIIAIGIIVTLSVALSFYKINNKPFVNVLQSASEFYFGSKLYIWKKTDKKIENKEESTLPPPEVFVPKLSDSKLKELSWSLDIKDNKNDK